MTLGSRLPGRLRAMHRELAAVARSLLLPALARLLLQPASVPLASHAYVARSTSVSAGCLGRDLAERVGADHLRPPSEPARPVDGRRRALPRTGAL
jgi:hypothetical protein